MAPFPHFSTTDELLHEHRRKKRGRLTWCAANSLLTGLCWPAIAALSACAGSSEVQEGPYVPPVSEVRPAEFSGDRLAVFGWNSLRELGDATERQFGAGMLSRVVGVAEGPDGNVYVLDGTWRKIVVFDSSGNYKKLILGGYGEGPGEFGRPRGFAVAPNGTMAVLDDAPRRVSVFSPMGVLLSTVNLSERRGYKIALDNASVWVLHAAREAGRNAIVQYDTRTGEEITSVGEVDALLAKYMSFGAVGRITLGTESEIVWALPTPTVVRRISPNGNVTTGALVFPSAIPETRKDKETGRDIEFVAAATRGIAVAESVTLVYYMRFLHLPGPGQKIEYFLALSTEDGTRYFSFGDQEHRPNGFAASRDGSAIYLAIDDPYPRVEKYSLPVVEVEGTAHVR